MYRLLEETFMIQFIHKAILSHNTIIIHRHFNPDGDALGSQIGLRAILQATFPQKRVYAVGDEVVRFQSLGMMDTIPDEAYQGALVIILDSSDLNLISDSRYQLGKTIVKIDHHIPKNPYGDVSLVDVTEISCSSMIAKMTKQLNYTWNEVAAQALFVGLVSDSNRFLYHGTNASTFQIASQLAEYPFDLDAIYRMLYIEPLAMVRLRAKMTLSFQETKHHVAYIMTKKADWMKSGADFQTISRDMVKTMSGIEGIYIWVNFTEDESSKIVAEIRSNTMNINPVATKYGGGGHAFASGAYLDSFDKAYQMLEDLDHMMEEYYEHQKR